MSDQTGITNPTPQAHEDPFFVLRDCRELFQQRLVDIARETGVTSPAVIDAFSREIGEAHDELASTTRQDGFGQTAGLTASRISLVGHDDLELEIRIGEIASHLKSNEHIDHRRIQLRYMTLLRQPKMTAEENPVGLDSICRGLLAICKASEYNLEQNLIRLGRLEEQLHLRLPDVYLELNELLERHRVEPAQVRAVQRESSGRPSAQSAMGGTGSSGGAGFGSGPGGANPLAALQQTLQQQFAGDESSSPGMFSVNAAGSAGNFALNASALVMLNHLIERLGMIELQQASAMPGTSLRDDAPPALRTIRSKDLDLPLGKPAAIALDTLSLIFDGIFAAPDLPDVIKSAIGRLQIPLLKLAILDASFFADNRHPARQLINRMARAAIGLSQETGREHPICVILGKLVNDVRALLEKNDGNLSPQLAELEALIAKRDQATQDNAQPYIQLVLEHEAREASQTSARNWLSSALAKTSEPAVANFLSQYWLRVMQAAYLDGGIARARWKECEATVEELIWSVQPKQTPEERKQLLSLIPSLIKRINAGLDLIKIPSSERTPFLNACFELQTAALRSRPDASAPLPPERATAEPLVAPLFPPMPGATPAPAVQLLECDGKLVQYLGQPAEMQSPWRTGGASAWKEGDWISFYLPDGERLCGRHSWKGSPSGTVLLFNPDWGYAVALAPLILEQQLRDSRARIVSEISLFDEAAERALEALPTEQKQQAS